MVTWNGPCQNSNVNINLIAGPKFALGDLVLQFFMRFYISLYIAMKKQNEPVMFVRPSVRLTVRMLLLFSHEADLSHI